MTIGLNMRVMIVKMLRLKKVVQKQKMLNTQGCSYNSRSGMVWSSTPSSLSKTKHRDNVNSTPGPAELTAHVASVEDAFLCFTSEETLKKILLYSNTAGNSSRTLS